MMTLYSTATCPFSHRCRIVLHEKDMDFQVIDVDPHNKPEDLAVISPYGRVPVLIERDLVLYESNIINEYIDDRFPHPQLMPAEPVMRARARLLLHRFEQELFCHIDAIEQNDQKVADKKRVAIADSLTLIAPIFEKQKFMLGDEYSMLDVAIAPLLWRLDHYGIR
ncbi:glutathione S-transferase N-terminal domain-containing protein, partial [Nitrosomonas nitrosa]